MFILWRRKFFDSEGSVLVSGNQKRVKPQSGDVIKERSEQQRLRQHFVVRIELGAGAGDNSLVPESQGLGGEDLQGEGGG